MSVKDKYDTLSVQVARSCEGYVDALEDRIEELEADYRKLADVLGHTCSQVRRVQEWINDPDYGGWLKYDYDTAYEALIDAIKGDPKP